MADSYTFKGDCTFEEYFEFCKIETAKRRLWALWLTLLVAAFLFAGALLHRVYFHEGKYFFHVGLVVLYGCVILPGWFRYRCRKYWKQYYTFKDGIEVTVTPDGVDVKDNLGSIRRVPWGKFYRFQETRYLFVLQFPPHNALLLPKRLLAEGDHAAVRQLLSAVNAPKPPGEPLA